MTNELAFTHYILVENGLVVVKRFSRFHLFEAGLVSKVPTRDELKCEDVRMPGAVARALVDKWNAAWGDVQGNRYYLSEMLVDSREGIEQN